MLTVASCHIGNGGYVTVERKQVIHRNTASLGLLFVGGGGSRGPFGLVQSQKLGNSYISYSKTT